MTHPSRAAIAAKLFAAETRLVEDLASQARLPAPQQAQVANLARKLVEGVRAKRTAQGSIDSFMQQFSLSSEEGVVLMCLAESLLRIPDAETADKLIADKIGEKDWEAHLGQSQSVFVNASAWGLMLTGKLVELGKTPGNSALSSLKKLVSRSGEPFIRTAMKQAMRIMGKQFVLGRTIAEALETATPLAKEGWRFSFDMLGESAMTAEDAQHYHLAYVKAVEAVGKRTVEGDVFAQPSVSVKLSALHPRYEEKTKALCLSALKSQMLELALLAKAKNVGLTVDAEEVARLDISLELFNQLAAAPELKGWNGLGLAVQAYGRRAKPVLDWLAELAVETGRVFPVRLVKGAYWDAEIKRAQEAGYETFPVFTRKVSTDVSYLACAKYMLSRRDVFFPQFATHNAQTVAAIAVMAGEDRHYEFQRLHGMGQSLYDQVVSGGLIDQPCRIYAPVGSHEDLLAYLVRRLLENGANTSFVNRIGDANVSIDELIADPVALARESRPVGGPHPKIAQPRALFGAERANSAGVDLCNEDRLAELSDKLATGKHTTWHAAPLVGQRAFAGATRPVHNPADHRDIVGHVVDASPEAVAAAFELATGAAPGWADRTASERAACLSQAADIMAARTLDLIGLIIREAGKSAANAIAEVREAIDFLRYYAAEVRRWPATNPPHALGPVVCISPWNFPLAIFTGQVAAALAAGNPVLAKPAEETPLVAAEAVRMLREAGIPDHIVQLLPGDGSVGAALVADPRIAAVMFTGSTEVARLIRRRLASRLSGDGRTIPLIAETGGINAMVADSSALAEQVVADVIASAFDSAGQRCSALRILCLQVEVADRMLAMLRGALAELTLGDPGELATDVGPVISEEARRAIVGHIEAMRARGHKVEQHPLPAGAGRGSFVAPTLIEIDRIADVGREVFGPVLHVLRYRREDLDRVIDDINGTGYGLTFGLHTRIDETIARVTDRIRAGNIYVNRNIIGAVVGVQPFGGHGMSGTGPKAGGPLYLQRLVRVAAARGAMGGGGAEAALRPARDYCDWLRSNGHHVASRRVQRYIDRSPLGTLPDLTGPVGERNVYSRHARGRIVVLPATAAGLLLQVGAALATGNVVVLETAAIGAHALASLPPAVAARIERVGNWASVGLLGGILFEGDVESLRVVDRQAAEHAGAIVSVHALSVQELASGDPDYPLEWLIDERSVSVNTAAAGGNASLMTIG